MTAADHSLLTEAEATAAAIASAAAGYETRRDRRRRRRITPVLEDDDSRTFLLELTDEVLRIHDPARAARRLHDLAVGRPAPRFVTGLDRLALWAGARLGPSVPRLVMPLAVARLRREFAGVVLAAEPGPFDLHLARRKAQGIQLNVNVLGEAILGEAEAVRRQQAIVEQLQRPGVGYVSVKVSAICARLDVAAFDHSVARIVERLRPIFAEAARHRPAKFVNLDMEEYRDLQLTTAAFARILGEPAFDGLDAGVVLQAYLPDSLPALEDLCTWAVKRHARTGAAVKVRIVKGANLAMEQVDAELHGWPQAPYETKAEVDANFKRLLDVALRPEYAGAIRVGAASHNLFDVGWALAVREALGAHDRVEVEMLEGMANPQAVATRAAAGDLLLYAPIVRRDDFEAAVAYLVRRLDENTAPENFLRRLYSLQPGNPAWAVERDRFRQAVADRHLPAGPPRRVQDRASEGRGAVAAGAFRNEPDTDFTLPANRRWLGAVVTAAPWPSEIPAVVDGQEVVAPLTGIGIDPSVPDAPSPLYRYVEADLATVERAVAVACRASPGWQAASADDRRSLLHQVAAEMVAGRGTLVAAMMRDGGKVVGEADPEVSEAIDFARYYGDHALDGRDRFEPHGVVVVASPWNFPLAIPAGGVLGALAAGNAVILKPAPETVLIAALLARQCWAAGVPSDVLQFVPCADDETGQRLVTHPDVDAVVLTGAWDTARLFLGWKPGLALHAETSGKNAIVVSAAADLDDAIRDIVHSAFGHAGQKCSAASLAIVEASVHDDERFQQRLADAVASLRVGPATDPAIEVGPLIRPPSGPLLRQLTTLDPGERWLVEPGQVGTNAHLWRPGVKIGVRPGSQLHLTECFGPVLGILRADDLDHAVALQNQPAFGLTGGLHSLDSAEVRHWLAHVQVGNAYVNRHITGAIVQRQPFGGWKRSVVGPAAKAGGPGYVASLGSWPFVAHDADRELARARASWPRLAAGDDPTGLKAESNVLRHRPLGRVVLRSGPGSDDAALAFTLAIAAIVGTSVDVSDAGRETDDEFVTRLLGAAPPDRVRLLGGDPALRLRLLDAGLEVDVTPVAGNADVELLRWSREQAVSRTMHRHGNLLLLRDPHQV